MLCTRDKLFSTVHVSDKSLMVPFYENHGKVKSLSLTINQRHICRNIAEDVEAQFQYNTVEKIIGVHS